MISRTHLLGVSVMAAVGGCALFAMDYYAQASAAIERGERFDMAAWSAGISTRLADASELHAHRQERARLLEEGPLAAFPTELHGWSIREWQAGDTPRLAPQGDVAEVLVPGDEGYDDSADTGRTNWVVYAKRRQIMAASAEFVEGDGAAERLTDFARSLAGGAEDTAEDSGEADGSDRDFAVVYGVDWIVTEGAADAPEDAPRVYEARLGDEMLLTIRAVADESDVYKLMARIDYDALNGMLSAPLEDVGSHVPTWSLASQRRAAEREARLAAEAASEVQGELVRRGDIGLGTGASVAAMPGVDEDAARPEVRVNRPASSGGGTKRVGLTGGNCRIIGGMKRCSISGGD